MNNFKSIIILTLILSLGLFFRTFQLGSNPPGFYSDEASYAYNAYSILKTGIDEHGVFLPITTEAFGDYKLPVMLYSIVGTFAVFGDSEWSARLPAAIYGTATILALYFLVKELWPKKNSEHIALLAAAFLAITPAHIFVSRGTWELTPALLFITIGTITFIKATTKTVNSNWLYLLTAICFILSIYSYNSARIFTPLFGISLALIYWKELKLHLKKHSNIFVFIGITTISFVLLLPILTSFQTPELTQRAKYISIFYDKGVESRLFDAIRSDPGQPVRITQALHNKPVFYLMDFTKRYLSHFDLNFLFVTGDTFEIFYMVGLGVLPIILFIPLVFGVYILLKNINRPALVLLSWLFISPIASAFTIFTPSLSRAQNLIIPLVIISASGTISIAHTVKNRVTKTSFYMMATVSLILLLINIMYVFNQYFIFTPRVVAHKWNDGFKETVDYVNSHQDQYDRIIISSSRAPSYIFYAWNIRIDPNTFQSTSVVDHTPDQNGLIFTSQIGKFHFTKNISEDSKNIHEGEKVLLVGFEDELSTPDLTIYSRDGKIVTQLKDNL